MDKEQARFVLQSFRPDGADVEDPEFTEALKLAMENRELGEWLASERAFDAAFANALGGVDLPENLREDIMACLAAERGDFSHAEDANDALWIGAMASIQPPAALRNAVIAAMGRTAGKDIVPANIWKFRRLAIPLAAAAGIALAFFITRPAPPTTVVEKCANRGRPGGICPDLRIALFRPGRKAGGPAGSCQASERAQVAVPCGFAAGSQERQGSWLPGVSDRWQTRLSCLLQSEWNRPRAHGDLPA